MTDYSNRKTYIDLLTHRFSGQIIHDDTLPKSVLSAFRAALTILIEEGYAALSMRAIAKHAGVSLGTLTYHFDSKDELIAKAVDLFIADEIRKLDDFPFLSEDPKITLEAMIRGQIELTLHPLSRKFDFEYWAYAERNQQTRLHFDELISRLRVLTAKFIQDVHPHLSEDRAMRRATLIQTLIEGMPIVMPLDQDRQSALGLDDFYEDTVQTALNIAGF